MISDQSLLLSSIVLNDIDIVVVSTRVLSNLC